MRLSGRQMALLFASALLCCCVCPTSCYFYSGKVARTIWPPEDPKSLDVSADGKQLLVSVGRGVFHTLAPDSREYEGQQAIFGRTEGEFFHTLDRRGSRAIYRTDQKAASQAVTRPPEGARDFFPCLSAGKTHLFFLRSLRDRPYSFGGRVPTSYDLWSVNLGSGVETRLTHLDLGFAEMGSRCVDRDAVFFTSLGNIYRYDLQSATVETIEESDKDVIGLSLWTPGKVVFLAEGTAWRRTRMFAMQTSGKARTELRLPALTDAVYRYLFFADEQSLYLLVISKEARWISQEFWIERVNIRDVKREEVPKTRGKAL